VRLREGFLDLPGVWTRDENANEVAEGRVAEVAAALELLGQEARHVVACGVDDRARVGLEALHEHASGRVTAGAARELREQLERPLFGAEVGQAECGVRIDNGSQLDAGEVV